MPKWVYDPKTASMVPVKHTNELDFAMTGAGFKISDYKHNLIFTIGPDDSISFNDRGIHQYLFTDYRTAAIVAQRIRRVYPNSRFGTPEGLLSWRRGEHPELDQPKYYRNNESMSADDKAMLRCLLEEVNPADVDKYVESLNETGYWFGLGGMSSVGQTPGTTQHGVKGLVNALPSAILSFLICPPATILRWIGAVRKRSEARWLKTRINPNRWLDFVATPWEKQEKVREQIRKEMAENTQYYYTRLANGEILRVVGSSTLEAKEMVMALEHKDIIPRYAEWNKKLSLSSEDDGTIKPHNTDDGTPDYKMWCIKFKDGEACYAFGLPDASDKEEIKKKAIESRKTMVEYYKHIKYKDEDNGDTKRQHHGGIGSEDDEFLKLFTVPQIEDMIELTRPSSYKIINENNYKQFETPTTSPMSWQERGYLKYKVNVGFGEFVIPAASDDEFRTIIETISTSTSNFESALKNSLGIDLNNKLPDGEKYYKVSVGDDWFIIPCEGLNESTRRILKTTFDNLEEAIATAFRNDNKKISDATKSQYNNLKQLSRNTSTSFIEANGHNKEGEDIFPSLYKDWESYTVATKIDSITKEILDTDIQYKSNCKKIDYAEYKPSAYSATA